MGSKTKTPAEMLLSWRKGEGLKQQEAAARLGVHSNFYSDYERGVRRSPSRALALKFQEVCGVPVGAWT